MKPATSFNQTGVVMCRKALHLLIFFSLVLTSTPILAMTHLVYPGGTVDYPNIQAALTAAADNDTVLLADGLFSGPGNRDLDFAGKAIVLVSVSGNPADCIIDAEGDESNWRRVFYIASGEDPGTVIQGLTIAGGLHNDGGGAYIVYESSPTFRDCIFTDNYSRGDGAAVFCWIDCSPTFTNCHFIDNVFVDYGSQRGGGFFGNGSSAQFTDCTFSGHETHAGGGAGFTYGGSPSFTRCSFRDNQAEYAGGAITLVSSVSASFTDCEFYQNSCDVIGGGGAALYMSGSNVEFLGCSFVDNSSAEILDGLIITGYESRISLENCVAAFNLTCTAMVCTDTLSIIELTCSNIFGNASDSSACLDSLVNINGNISHDPYYCNLSEGDLGLMVYSPCLPSNNSCAVLMGVHEEGCDAAAVGYPTLPSSTTAVLHSVHPNPFNPQVVIGYSLQRPSRVDLKIFDLSGRLVKILVDNEMVDSGEHETSWNGRDLAGRLVAAGTYLCRLETPDHSTSRPLTLIK
jgi:hypothetical protein